MGQPDSHYQPELNTDAVVQPAGRASGALSRAMAVLRSALRAAVAWFAGLPKPARLAGLTLLGLIALSSLLISLVFVRLAFGPINIDGYAPRIVSAVGARMPIGYHMDISGAAIALDGAGIGVQVSGVRLSDDKAQRLFSAPNVTIGFSLLSLAGGNLAPDSLRFYAPRIALADRGGDDQVANQPSETMTVADIVAVAFATLNPAGGIEEIELRDATLVAGAGIGFENVNARLFAETTRNNSPTIALEVNGGTTPVDEWAMNGRLLRREDGGLTGELAFADLVAGSFVPDDGSWTGGLVLESPVSGQIAFATLDDGTLADGRFDILVGAGEVRAGEDTSFLLDEARVSGQWDAARRILAISPSRFLAGRSRAVLGGEIGFPDSRSMAFGTIPIGIGFSDVRIATRDNADPVAIDAIVFDAVYDVAARQARVQRFDFLAGEASISTVGFIRQAPGSPGIALRGGAARMSVDVFKSLWPDGFAPVTREWVMRQVKDGVISSADINVEVAPGQLAAPGAFKRLGPDSVSVRFETEQSTFGYFHDLPPVRNARLTGEWSPSSFSLAFAGDDGRIDLPSGKTLRVTGGSYQINDTQRAPVQAQLEILAQGPLEGLLELLDNDPLNIPGKRGIASSSAAGDVSMKMTMDMPITEGLTVADVGLAVTGTIDGLVFPLGSGRTVEKGDVAVSVADGIMRVTGEGVIDGVNADLALTEPLYDGAGARERQVTLVLDAKSRKALGIDFGDFLQGTFPANITELGNERRRVEADLKNARLYQPAIGLDKPSGSPASFTALLEPDGDNGDLKMSDMRLSGRELLISGTGRIRKDGGIAALDLTTFHLQEGDQARLKVRTDTGGNFTAEIEAVRFDMRRVLDNAKTGGLDESGARSGDKRRYLVSAVIGSARGYNGEVLQSVDIDLDLRGDKVQLVKMTGAFADNSTMRLEIARQANQADPLMSISSDNAGRMLRWLDLYSRVNRGQIGIRARLGAQSGDARGRMQLVNFTIDRDPSLSTLINQTQRMAEDPSWAEASRAAPSGPNIGFDELYVDFTRSRGVFDFRNGVIRGPVIGATFDGQVDFAGRRIGLNGTYVPLYAINNFFGRVPLIGTILGGRANEGLIGVNFSVQGNLNRPNLVVNPVSAVTPGIFRLLLDAPSRTLPNSGPGNVDTDRLDPLSQGEGR